MKRLLLIFLLIHIFRASAQDPQGNDYYFGENFHFNGYSTDKRTMVRSDIVFVKFDKYISHIFKDFHNNKTLPGNDLMQMPNSPILLGIKLNPQLKNFISPKIQNPFRTYNRASRS